MCVRQRQSIKYTVNNIRVYIDYQNVFLTTVLHIQGQNAGDIRLLILISISF